jgi:hypothetical protein
MASENCAQKSKQPIDKREGINKSFRQVRARNWWLPTIKVNVS